MLLLPRSLPAALVVLLGASGASTATAATRQAPQEPGEPGALLLEADRRFQGAARDPALVLLARAETAIAALEDVARREALGAQAAALRARIDPLWSQRLELRRADGKDLLELGRAYLRRKLVLRAVDVLEAAVAADPAAAQEVLGYAQKQLATKSAPRAGATPKPTAERERNTAAEGDRLAALQGKFVRGKWDLRPTEVRSPRLEGGSTVYLVASAPTHADHRLSVDILIGDVDGSGALVFGGVDATDYYIVELLHQTDPGAPRYSNLSVHRIVGSQAIELARVAFDLTPQQRAGWQRLHVTIRGKDVVAGLGTGSNLRVSCPTVPHGGVGFFVTGNSPNLEPVAFRRLLIETPAPEPALDPDDAAGTGAAKPADASEPLAAELRALLEAPVEKAALEARLVELHAAFPRLAELADDAERTALATRLRQAIEVHDPLAKQAAETRVTLAERRVALARQYLERELPRAALLVVRDAARVETGAGAALHAELLAKLAPPPPQPLPAAEPCDVLRVLDGGEVLFGTAGWTLTPSLVHAPAPAGDETVFVGKTSPPKRGLVRVDVVLPPEQGARGGLAFDVRSAHDCAFAVVERRADRAVVRVHRYFAGNWTLFGEALGAAMPPGEAGFTRLELRFDGERVVLTTPGADGIELTLAARAATPRLGLFAASHEGAVSFRNLFVTSDG